jgi:hypothetical protein
VRFWVWFAATAKFLVPFALIAGAAGWMAAHLHAQAPPRLEFARQVLAPMTAPGPGRTLIRPLARMPLDVGPWLGAAWILGTAVVLGWRAAQWRALERALAAASPLAIPTALPALEGRGKGGPVVVGFLRPVLVLPPGLVERLTPAELEAVLEHEAQHARRMDNLRTLPLVLVQALYWFHPLVWWIGRRLMAGRERACDEAVLGDGTDAETYARGLLEACRLELEPAPVLAAAATGGANLKRRIRRIMADRPPHPLGTRGSAVLTAAISAAIAAPILGGVYTASPAPTARVLVALVRPIAAAVSPPPAHAPLSPTARAAPAPSTKPARVILTSAPAALNETVAYASEVEHPIRLVRRIAAPAFQPAPPEPRLAPAAPASGEAQLSADPAFLNALAERTAYVTGADLESARLDLRAAGACPTAGVMEAERRLGSETISTAFDGRVRRFVDEALAGTVGPRDLSPAMALTVAKALPSLRSALAAQFGQPEAARLIGEDRQGHEVYLVPGGRNGYVLVLVDDDGRIDAAAFCAAG